MLTESSSDGDSSEKYFTNHLNPKDSLKENKNRPFFK